VAVINPFETFAYNLGVALRAPEIVQIEDWITATDGTPIPPAVQPPRGRWVLVGFGRFGQAIANVLDKAGIEWKAFDPHNMHERDDRLVQGDYTENILHDAGIEHADVLVAGSDTDAVNLGATTLTRRVKPEIFVVIRQNQMQDRALVDAARANLKFVQSDIMVNECLQVLKTPMLSRFIARLRVGDREQASAVLARVRKEVGDGSPHSWAFECDVLQPGMFFAFFQRSGGSPFRIAQLQNDPTNPGVRMRVTPLMLEREGATILLPPEDTPLKPGDRILFAGDDVARRLQMRYLTEPGTVAWVCSGSEPPRGFIFRWWEQRRRANAN
jgi:Trk K+ transport system NAD-binding subunit